LNYDLSNNDIIHWEKDYSLSWNDFQGPPNPKNPRAASSAVGLVFDYTYDYDEKKTRIKIRIKDVIIKAIFIRTQSWVRKERFKTELARNVGLKHEQGHFDLAHEYTSIAKDKMITMLKGKIFSIPKISPEKLAKIIQKERDKITNPIISKIRKEHKEIIQKEYDDKTQHGTILEEQKQYDERFDRLRK